MKLPLVIDAQTAAALGRSAANRFVVVAESARVSCRGWGRRRTATQWDQTVTSLASVGRGGVVLARPSSELLRRLAWCCDHTVIRVPDEPSQAAWVAAIAAAVADAPRSVRERAIQVLAAGPQAVRSAICAGTDDALRHTSRPVAVARWASRAWQQCSWCLAGGLPGHDCAVCGVSVRSGAGT